MKISTASKFFIALILGLLTVFVIDPLDPTTISTPFCLGIILMGLSLRQSYPLVVAVSVVYSILTAVALIQFHRYHEAHIHISAHPYFWLFQRIGTFLVLCGLACYLAYYRTDTERALGRLRSILSKMPAPVVLSDASGNIVYANDAVTPILRQRPAEIIGKSYFNFFLMERMKGESIRSYFTIFEADTNATHELDIDPFDSDNAKRMTAQLICFGTGRNRVMITVLQNNEKTPDPAALISHIRV